MQMRNRQFPFIYQVQSSQYTNNPATPNIVRVDMEVRLSASEGPSAVQCCVCHSIWWLDHWHYTWSRIWIDKSLEISYHWYFPSIWWSLSLPQGLDFFSQDMGWGPQWTHLSKTGQCQLGYNMSQAWVRSGLQGLTPVSEHWGDWLAISFKLYLCMYYEQIRYI